jgi:LmbE family N-acetylglucosaminyl deacetylase
MTHQRILVVAAHPDDVDFGAAGTVALWTAGGASVTYCVVTDGDSGGFDPAVPRADVPGIRRSEQVAAARLVGVSDVRFLGHRDGALVASLDLRRDLARVIRQVRPSLVLSHSPEVNWENVYASHPDHRAVGEATLAAVYPDARNAFAFPELLADEGLEPHVVPELWLMGGPLRDHAVDITAVFERKLAAVRAHASQMPDPSGGAPARLAGWLRENGRRAGMPDGHLAEAFQRVRIEAADEA